MDGPPYPGDFRLKPLFLYVIPVRCTVIINLRWLISYAGDVTGFPTLSQSRSSPQHVIIQRTPVHLRVSLPATYPLCLYAMYKNDISLTVAIQGTAGRQRDSRRGLEREDSSPTANVSGFLQDTHRYPYPYNTLSRHSQRD